MCSSWLPHERRVKPKTELVKLSLYFTLGKHEVITSESQNAVLVVVRDRCKCKERVFVANDAIFWLVVRIKRTKRVMTTEEGGVRRCVEF
jgi:hypothetical protein